MFPNLGSFLAASLKRPRSFVLYSRQTLHFCRDPEFLKALDAFSGQNRHFCGYDGCFHLKKKKEKKDYRLTLFPSGNKN